MSRYFIIDEEMANSYLDILAKMRAEDFKVKNISSNGVDVELIGNTAVIEISGLIEPKSSCMSLFTDSFSTSAGIKTLKSLESSDEVSQIVLKMNTGGGHVTGTGNFSNYIKNMEIKTIAFCENSCSAGYWIASACDEIVVDPTGLLGSIGVIGTVEDKTALYSKNGVIRKNIASDNAPLKVVDISSDEGVQVIKDRVNKIALEFTNTIAVNRNVTADFVNQNFGKGGVLVGEECVAIGMADKCMHYEDFIKQINMEEKMPKENVDMSNYVLKSEVENNYVSKDEVSKNYISKEDNNLINRDEFKEIVALAKGDSNIITEAIDKNMSSGDVAKYMLNNAEEIKAKASANFLNRDNSVDDITDSKGDEFKKDSNDENNKSSNDGVIDNIANDIIGGRK